MTRTSQGLSIGALARTTGVNLETIRYYERIGLMPAPGRTDGGHRIYEKAHRDRLAFIRRSRELGFPIEDIRALLKLEESPEPCCAVREIASQHLETVRAKLADLTRLERVLSQTVEGCNTDAPTCAVLEMLETGA